MNHLTTTTPESEPVTLAEMRAHLGITQVTDTSRDAIITGRIISARQWSEHYTRKAFIRQTVTGYAADFPFSAITGECIALKAPLISVVSVKYVDATGVQQTLDPIKYLIDTVGANVIPAYDQHWPTVRAQLNSVQIQYISGFGEAEDVPESIKDAIRFIVGQWEVFQSSMEGVMRPFTIPNAAKQLLDYETDMREYF